MTVTQNSDQMRFHDSEAFAYAEREAIIQTKNNPTMLELHGSFSDILDQLATVWIEKVSGYGTSRYDEHDLAFDTWMNFSDIYRKFIRMEQLTRDTASGNKEALLALLDAYADMANYCVSALLVLERHVDRPHRRTQ